MAKMNWDKPARQPRTSNHVAAVPGSVAPKGTKIKCLGCNNNRPARQHPSDRNYGYCGACVKRGLKINTGALLEPGYGPVINKRRRDRTAPIETDICIACGKLPPKINGRCVRCDRNQVGGTDRGLMRSRVGPMPTCRTCGRKWLGPVQATSCPTCKTEAAERATLEATIHVLPDDRQAILDRPGRIGSNQRHGASKPTPSKKKRQRTRNK